MKSVFILLSVCAALVAGAAETRDDDAAAILSVLPSASSIVKTSYGYRITASGQTRFANRTSYGYRISDERGTMFLNRTRDGFRIQPAR